MKIYVASKFENKGAVRAAMAALREAGHVITFDWTPFENQPDSTPANIAHDYQVFCATSDVQGIHEADVLILLVQPEMRGAWVEMGVAVGVGNRIYVIDGHLAITNIFLKLPKIIHASGIEAVIRDLAGIGAVTRGPATPAGG